MDWKSKINISNLAYVFMFISFATFFINLANIKTSTFDEFHYVPAAKQWTTMSPMTNLEHPPVGKYLIALGIKSFGDNAIGWRIASVVAGAISITFCFLISALIFKDLFLSCSIGLFSLFNFWFFVQSRIAMLDIFMVTFMLGGIFYYLKYKYDEDDKHKNISFYISSIFYGLAVATKWSAVFVYLPFFILAILSDAHSFTKIQISKKILLKYFSYGILSIVVYFFTFFPYMFITTKLKMSFIDLFIHLPFEMLKMHESVPGEHLYASQWYTWPIMSRPIWYEYIASADKKTFQGLMLLGNPFQMFLGALSTAYLIVKWRKIQTLAKFCLTLFLCSWLIWPIAPRKLSFFYYYFPSATFYSFLVPMALRELFSNKTANKIMAGFVFISLGLFVFFLPILSGEVTADQIKGKWVWFQGWI